MEEFAKGPQDDKNDLDSLEGQDTYIESETGNAPSNNGSGGLAQPPESTGTGGQPPSPKPPHKARLRALLQRFNIYLLLFVVIIVLGAAVVVVAIIHGKSSSNQDITSQTLGQETLDQLANSDVTVGDVKQVLNVQSNAVFAGKVLVRSDLEVAGKIQVGGSLSLAGITVSGSSDFDEVQINKNLSVGGTTSLQGQLTVQKGISVNGSGTFKGAVSAPQLTVNALQLNGDLTLTHHLVPGGPTPARSNGSALGNGGTASVSGSDTAGTVNISTGTSTSAGCFVTVSFVHAFQSTPHVQLTPVGSGTASVAYYVNRSTTSFSICTASAAPSSSSLAFDYWVVD